MELTLIFVYNADSGLFNALTHYAHKTLSPGTYSQNPLRTPSYGAIGTQIEWKQFLTQLGIPLKFHLGAEFQRTYGAEKDIPAVYLQMDEEIKLLASPEGINKCTSVKELSQLIESKIDELA